MQITGDRLLQITLAVIGTLLMFLLNDFNGRLRGLETNLGAVQQNVEFIRGNLTGPLRPLP